MSYDLKSAEIVIKRKWAWTGSGVTWMVLVDGQEVGTLSNGNSLTVHSAPGHHTIVVGPSTVLMGARSKPFSFDVGTGERVELVGQATMMRPAIWRQGAESSRPSGAGRLGQAVTGNARNWPPGAATRGEPRGSTSRSPTPTASTVVEGARYEVPLGSEVRTVDNSRSSSSTTRVVRLTREWTRTCAVDVEHITTVHGSAGLGIHLLDLKVEAERTLSKTYSTTTEERETFEEEVTLNIGDHTKTEIVFSWKEIRQKGVVQVTGEHFEARVPYEVVIGLTFDQRQIDA